jgi:hypothetical protein
VLLVEKEDVRVEVDEGDEEKPEEVDLDGEGDGLLEGLEGLEEGLVVLGLGFTVLLVLCLTRVSGLFFCKLHLRLIISEYFWFFKSFLIYFIVIVIRSLSFVRLLSF